MSTYLAKTNQVARRWFLVNADGVVLGQVALQVANLLRGRGKTIYTPHVDTGDFVIVVNAEKVRLTGKKETQKQYMFYSGWRGGERHVAARDMRKRKPTFMVERAVRGMLPKNTLAREMIKKMHVYAGPRHPHAAQKPETLASN